MSKDLMDFGNPSGLDNAEPHELEERIAENIDESTGAYNVMDVIASFFNNPPKDWIARRFGDILAEPVRNGIYKKKEFHGRGCKMVN